MRGRCLSLCTASMPGSHRLLSVSCLVAVDSYENGIYSNHSGEVLKQKKNNGPCLCCPLEYIEPTLQMPSLDYTALELPLMRLSPDAATIALSRHCGDVMVPFSLSFSNRREWGHGWRTWRASVQINRPDYRSLLDPRPYTANDVPAFQPFDFSMPSRLRFCHNLRCSDPVPISFHSRHLLVIAALLQCGLVRNIYHLCARFSFFVPFRFSRPVSSAVLLCARNRLCTSSVAQPCVLCFLTRRSLRQSGRTRNSFWLRGLMLNIFPDSLAYPRPPFRRRPDDSPQSGTLSVRLLSPHIVALHSFRHSD